MKIYVKLISKEVLIIVSAIVSIIKIIFWVR